MPIRAAKLVPDWVTSSAELEEVKPVLPVGDARAHPRCSGACSFYIAGDTQRAQMKDIAKSRVIVSTAK